MRRPTLSRIALIGMTSFACAFHPVAFAQSNHASTKMKDELNQYLKQAGYSNRKTMTHGQFAEMVARQLPKDGAMIVRGLAKPIWNKPMPRMEITATPVLRLTIYDNHRVFTLEVVDSPTHFGRLNGRLITWDELLAPKDLMVRVLEATEKGKKSNSSSKQYSLLLQMILPLAVAAENDDLYYEQQPEIKLRETAADVGAESTTAVADQDDSTMASVADSSSSTSDTSSSDTSSSEDYTYEDVSDDASYSEVADSNSPVDSSEEPLPINSEALASESSGTIAGGDFKYSEKKEWHTQLLETLGKGNLPIAAALFGGAWLISNGMKKDASSSNQVAVSAPAPVRYPSSNVPKPASYTPSRFAAVSAVIPNTSPSNIIHGPKLVPSTGSSNLLPRDLNPASSGGEAIF